MVVPGEPGSSAPSVRSRGRLVDRDDSVLVLVHAKGVYCEWGRTLETTLAFEHDHPELADPPGFRL